MLQASLDDHMHAITCERLDLYYGKFHALKNVHFYVAQNRITSLIGPSGCGKSTLLRVFNRMNDLVEGVKIEGEINIFGRKISEIDVNQLRRKVGMVFQRPNPFPLSVYENLAYGLRVHGINGKAELEEAVHSSLTSVGLWNDLKDRLKENALKLSGEQQQRLCIARLIAMKPEVLLMDEPCSALDPVATARVEELMQDLKSRYSILIVTHNMQQAGRVSDDCGFMLMGELIEIGKTSGVFTNPVDKRTEDYITGRYG